MKTFLMCLGVISLIVSGCSSYSSFSPAQRNGLQVGSMTSKNLFIDSSQFANRTVKLRLRNSSGEPLMDIGRLRGAIESGLISAGYQIGDRDFGLVIDVNVFQMQSVYRSNLRNNSGLAALVGGVVGYEAAKQSGGISSTSGAILGAVAGIALEEVLRTHSENATYIALCDVNIGVVKKEYTKNDRFVVGGNKIEHKEPDEPDAFKNFSRRELVRVAAYAGDDANRENQTIEVLVDRLGRVVANLL